MKLQDDVYINEAAHTYWRRTTKRQYVSVSKFLDCFDEKVDWESVARNCAGKGKYKGMTQAMILKAWDENRDKSAKHGTKIHKILEDYSKSCKIAPENEEFRPMVESINSEKTEYYRRYQEVILYIDFKDQSGKYAGIAGTVDEILLVNKNGLTDIEDFKTNISKGIEMYNDKGKTKKFPINHLQDCNYVKYSCQLSLYAYMYQSLTKGCIRSLNIRFIPPDNYLNHRKIPVMYMMTDVVNMIAYFESNYNESKGGVVEIDNEEECGFELIM